ILSSEFGNTAVAAFNHVRFKPGTVLLECHYLLDSASAHGQHIRQYLPPVLLRLVVDERGNNHDSVLGHSLIEQTLAVIDKQTAIKIVRMKQAELKQLLEKSNHTALALAPSLIANLRKETTTMLLNEINRLRELAEI